MCQFFDCELIQHFIFKILQFSRNALDNVLGRVDDVKLVKPTIMFSRQFIGSSRCHLS